LRYHCHSLKIGENSLRKTVEFVHVALGLVPEILNLIDVIILFYKEFGVVSPKAMGNCYDQKRCSRATFALPIYL
jgi:hypothetical protein